MKLIQLLTEEQKKMTDEQWCDIYFEVNEIFHFLKQFVIKPVIHSIPADYGLSQEQALEMRKRYLLSVRSKILKEYNHWSDEFECDSDYKTGFNKMKLDEYEVKLNKANKDILFLSRSEDNNKFSFNIGQLRSIPINNIVSVNAAGFFKIRDEKTPSCKWYKNDNTWVDFGGDNRKHDVIDLVMTINHIDFIGACKMLSL